MNTKVKKYRIGRNENGIPEAMNAMDIGINEKSATRYFFGSDAIVDNSTRARDTINIRIIAAINGPQNTAIKKRMAITPHDFVREISSCLSDSFTRSETGTKMATAITKMVVIIFNIGRNTVDSKGFSMNIISKFLK